MDKTRVMSVLNKLIEAQSALSIQLYFVGGCVRNYFWNQLSFDFDLSLDGDLDELFTYCLEHIPEFSFKRSSLGSLKLDLGEYSIDIVPFRRELYQSNNGLPSVTKGDLQSDLMRRDFTVNTGYATLTEQTVIAMFDVTHRDSLQLFAHHALFYEDLKARRLRVLHEQSFSDDASRILRGIYYSVTHEMHFEENTDKYMNLAIQNGSLGRYSEVRFKHLFLQYVYSDNGWEFLRLFRERLTEADNLIKEEGFTLFETSNLLPRALRMTEQSESILEDLKHTAQKLESLVILETLDIFDTLDIRLMAILLLYEESLELWTTDLGTEKGKELAHYARRMIFLQNQLNHLFENSRDYGVYPDKSNFQDSKLACACNRNGGEDAQLNDWILYSTIGELDDVERLLIQYMNGFTEKTKKLIENYHKNQIYRTLHITGKDLLSLGIAEGRIIGELLKRLLQHKINHQLIWEKEDEIKWIESVKDEYRD